MSFPQRIIIIQQNNLTSNIVNEIITQILPRFKKYHKTQIKDNKFEERRNKKFFLELDILSTNQETKKQKQITKPTQDEISVSNIKKKMKQVARG